LWKKRILDEFENSSLTYLSAAKIGLALFDLFNQ